MKDCYLRRVQCINCKEWGHYAKQCPLKEQSDPKGKQPVQAKAKCLRIEDAPGANDVIAGMLTNFKHLCILLFARKE